MMQDSERLAILWTKAQPVVAAYISSLVPDYHHADDILQQTAVVLVSKFEQYNLTQPFLPWALGIAKREVLKKRRQMARDRHVFTEEFADRLCVAYEKMAGQFDGYAAALGDCVKQLNDRERNVLHLRYSDDLSPTDAADSVQMTPGAMRVLLHRVRESLRMCVQRRMNEMRNRP
jgi:RNA polymerase sigma-70 factor (ECF subfamily)